MSTKENPFTPTFGEIPTQLAGRQSIIENTTRAFNATRRRPELTTILSGARGTGKTTLLSLIASRASQAGWITTSVTAMPGMLEDIEVRALKASAHLIEAPSNTNINRVGIPQIIDIKLSHESAPQTNWRSRMEDILDALETHNTGLLITVDEVDATLDEMIQLAAIYQHFVRENRKIALIMAGLPSRVSALVSDKTVSFLRRAEMLHLGRIDDFEIENALRKTIEGGGRSASNADLKRATEAIDGFPFMLQLIGFRAWDEHPDADAITSSDFDNGISLAREEMRARIFEATYRELSDADIAFLKAMLDDEGDSRVADIATRLGWSSSQVAQYRRRLLEAGIVGERRRGIIGFDMPFFREFLQKSER
jgi:hypothetical protein